MLIPDLESIINAITGIPSPITGIAKSVIKDKLQRNEIVIKLLKQFNLAPEHPPADFSGVYAYALVEYGVGKPKPMLELFRLEQIKKAFRKALDHNNPSILLSEVDTLVDGYALGDEIKTLGLDIKREVAAFATVFIEVAKRSRTPADVLMSQQIGSLHKRIANVQEQLDRLPTLEGIRTEMARLASQSYLAMPLESSKENQCRAIALAQQMRGWFETLGYGFEKYEIWAEDYFEFILKIPVRRSFDRILVRGVAGEVGLSDVMALARSVQEQKTDEGWLVSNRRISRAAREEVKKEENHRLDCYTFDELIDLDADFSSYLDWLEEEIKHKKIDTQYVPLACSKEEIDPVSKLPIGVSHYGEDGWIDGYIDIWLDDLAKEHISVLGEFGTGKTWFALHYAWVALQRYQDAQKRGVERPRLPLVITLRDFAKALNVENVLAGFFFTQHNIRINSEVFDQLNRMGKLLLIFDGFDEMAAKVDRQQMINNFWELAKVVVPGAKVILTCRTEHFPEAKEGRALLNAELLASTANLTGETPQFEVLELEKFNDEQIRQVLSHQAETATVEQVMGNPQLLDLARRPVMTELILEALPDIEAGKPVDMSRVYLYAVRRKMERDIKAERTFTSSADKLYFLCELSWEMLSTDQMSLNYRLFPERIRRLFRSMVQEEKDLDHWHYDMMGQTMLIRNADGDYTPAHRSFLEFFVAYKFAAELGVLAEDFTELVRAQAHINNDAAPVDCTWSSYLQRQVDAAGNILPTTPLKSFTNEPLCKLRETFGQSQLTKAVMDLLVPMINVNSQASIINIIKATRFKRELEVGYVGGNAATLLIKVDKAALEGKDFSCAVIKGADFSTASLRHTNFAKANLANCVFTEPFGSVLSIAYSPDAQVFATAEANSSINLWQVSSGQRILSFKGHTDWVSSVVFSPDGKTLASGSHDATLKLWNIHTGKCLRTLQGHTKSIRKVAFCPNGITLASSSDDQTVKIWNTHTGECLNTLKGHVNKIWSIAIHLDGETLASASEDQTVKLWNMTTGQCLKTLPGTSRLKSIFISLDGKILAYSSGDTIVVWDIVTNKYVKTLHGHTNQVNSIAITLDNKTLASGSSDATIKIWDIQSGECLTTLQGHNIEIRAIAFSPDCKTLVSSSKDQTLKLWNIQTGECLKTIQGYANWVNSVAFSPDGTTLASGNENAAVTLWNIDTGECLKNFNGHTNWVSSVAFNPDGTIIASGGGDQTVKLWDISTGQCKNTLPVDNSRMFSLVISHDGTILASGSSDKTVALWDLHTAKFQNILQGHDDWVLSVAISPDSKTLFSASFDATVKLWDISTGRCLKTLKGHTGQVWSVAVSPNGTILASASDDKTVKIWDVYKGECIKTLELHSSQISSLVFSGDGKILVGGSHDATVKLWDVRTGKCLNHLHGHTNRVECVAISPKGTIIASGSYDETIKLWDITTGECLKTIVNKPYAGMNMIDVIGLTKGEEAILKALGAVGSE